MSRRTLLAALALSVLLNVGVLAAVAYRLAQAGSAPVSLKGGEATSLPDYLRLDAAQRRAWDEAEASFLRDVAEGGRRIAAQRTEMIHEIFSEQPDRSRIESLRQKIQALQTRQQQRTIEQLLKEKALLNDDQRRALTEYLLRQNPPSTPEERLHAR